MVRSRSCWQTFAPVCGEPVRVGKSHVRAAINNMLASSAGRHLLGRVGCRNAFLLNRKASTYGEVGCMWDGGADEKDTSSKPQAKSAVMPFSKWLSRGSRTGYRKGLAAEVCLSKT